MVYKIGLSDYVRLICSLLESHIRHHHRRSAWNSSAAAGTWTILSRHHSWISTLRFFSRNTTYGFSLCWLPLLEGPPLAVPLDGLDMYQLITPARLIGGVLLCGAGKCISSPSEGPSGFDLSALNWHRTRIATWERIQARLSLAWAQRTRQRKGVVSMIFLSLLASYIQGTAWSVNMADWLNRKKKTVISA